MSSEHESTSPNQVNPSGGSVVDGNINTGGDFVGRDQTIHGDNVGRDKIVGAGDIHIYHYPASPAASPVASNDVPAPGDPPYQGMLYYDVADADRFFGRERLTAELVDHLRQHRLLAVVGASGSGKSSLVRARLLPTLQGKKPLIDGSRPPQGSERWAYHLITPTARPLESLAASLTRTSESVTATSTLIDDLRGDTRSLHLYARRLVSGEQRLLLLVDQFEELFTLCKDETEQGDFVNNLLYATNPDGVITLVLTLRADFYHHCARFPDLRNALEHQQKYIGAMSHDELRRAIAEPAIAGGWEFQAGLIEQLLQDVGHEPGALPLLSHALLETWHRRSGRTLTLAGYRAAGGVQGAIAKTADEVFNRFTDEQKSIARIIFLRLTELGEGVQDTRRRVRPDELKLTQASADTVQQILKTLADARLVTTDEDEVEVAHEALIRNWETLREWLDDDREGNRIQRRLTEATNQWIEFGKEPSLLYRGILLQQAQEWLQSTLDLPNEREMEFLQTSVAATASEAKRAAELATERETNRQRELANQRQLAAEQSHRARILRNAMIISCLLLLIALALAEWGRRSSRTASNNAATATIALATSDAGVIEVGKERDRAHREEEIAATRSAEAVIAQANAEQQVDITHSHQLATLSTSELNHNNYELAILLSVEAGKIITTEEAFSTLRAAIANPWHSRSILYGYTQGVWNKNETKILTRDTILDATSGKVLVKFNGIHQPVWSQDESKILALTDNNAIQILDATTGKELVKFVGHTNRVWQALWSQDESKILTSSFDNTARIWDIATGKELVKLTGHKDKVWQAVWNKDESKILTTSWDSTARIWDAITGNELRRLVGHANWVSRATWSNDESKILSTSFDNTARIWDAFTGAELLKLEAVSEAIWSRNGSKILTTNNDNTASIWDSISGKELVKFVGHTNYLHPATWSKDESKVLTASADNTVRIWDAATGQELVKFEGHVDNIWQATWNTDESKILTTSDDHTVRIWDAITGKELFKLTGNTDRFEQAVWSKDETKILAASWDNTLRIWDVLNNQELVKFSGHTGPILQVTWNRDKSKILTRSDDYTVRIWDVASGQELVKLTGHTNWVLQATWSRDENKVLTASADQTARIWDAITGKELVKLIGHTDWVEKATWNQDESRIWTRSPDSTVRIWDANSGKELTKLEMVYQVAWSHDETKILTSNGYPFFTSFVDHIWDADSGKELVKIEGHTWHVTQVIWSRDDSKILIISDDSTSRIWDATSGKELVKLVGHTGPINQAVWNKDETEILTSSDDNTARIWDAASGRELIRLIGHTSYVIQAIWIEHESKIMTRSGDNTVRIWQAASGKELVKLSGHTNTITQVIWSKDSSKILTRSEDNTIRLWDATNGKELVKLTGHIDTIYNATWNQGESKILTISADHTARIWDVTNGKELFRLEEVNWATWTQNVDQLLTINRNNTMSVWFTEMRDLLKATCTLVPRNFTWVEWMIYMEHVQGKYRPTCPDAPIPPDAISGIQEEVRQQIHNNQIASATNRLEELNDWLQVNGQFKNYGVDVEAFVAEVSATSTAEAHPTFALTPTPLVTPSPK